MLKMIRCNEQERKNAVVDAFKTIYLTTDTRSMAEHTTTIKDLAYDNLDDFQNIVSKWTSKGIFDNSVIDKCWHYHTQREQVFNKDAQTAAEILRMAAIGKTSSCRLLAVASLESKNPPFRIKHTDQIFQNLSNTLVIRFLQKFPYYSEAMQASLDFIFRVCSKPIEIAEKILRQIDQKLKDYPRAAFLIIRLCDFLVCLAVKLLGYLDNSVYRESKRRHYLRDERKKDKNKNKKKGNKSILNASMASEISSNDSDLMEAEAEDAEAEFILKVLESDVVSSTGALGQYSSLILNLCHEPDIYNDILLQVAAVTALMRYLNTC